ncbi:hypothetical protein [Xanthomonas sp. XNM01]|uniref:hypothetical protein n=1 Tax=Xanthomonas sp. XNM01 TaxID=2769289 RepID=UPI0017844A5A|nr:hypothetical protein [Xanthomonas sp. XNM01]MBD9369869.1 hypothetical protein [Xanthomonas sp. XNM01]
MSDLVLRNLDPILAERLRRVGMARGWNAQDTVLRLLEQGLLVAEQEVSGGFVRGEVDALSDAIAALKQLPAGQGF